MSGNCRADRNWVLTLLLFAGLQLDVLRLYRDLLKVAKTKPLVFKIRKSDKVLFNKTGTTKTMERVYSLWIRERKGNEQKQFYGNWACNKIWKKKVKYCPMIKYILTPSFLSPYVSNRLELFKSPHVTTISRKGIWMI